MPTALTIISNSMYEIGAYAPGDTIASAHKTLGMYYFQNMLDTWQADQLTLHLQDRETFALLSGVNTFTIGPSGDLAVTRPVYIEGMNYINPGSSPTTEVPMGPMDRDAYLALAQKTLSSSLPQQFYYNGTVTNGTMFIWPTVSQNVTLAIYFPKGIDSPATLTTNVVGPQGYAEAFHFQLALRLCGPMSRPIPQGLPQMAASAYAGMVRANVEPGQMGVDAALVPTYGGAFNVLTGTSSGPSNQR